MSFRNTARSLLFAGAILLVSLPTRPEAHAQQVGPADAQAIVELFHAYEAGDHEVVARRLSAEDFRLGPSRWDQPRQDPADVVQQWLAALSKDWRGGWRPIRATFLLEMAIAASHAGAAATIVALPLSLGGTGVIQRPTPLGANATEDRFEMTWHRAAIGVLEGLPTTGRPRMGPTMIGRYLDSLEKRYGAARVHGFDGYIALSRAIASAQQCCTRLDFNTLDDTGLDPERAGTAASDGAAMEVRLDGAIPLFEVAARDPEVSTEARVRGAFLLYRRHKYDQALRWIAGVPDPSADPDLAFWNHLVHGQILDAVRRFEEAGREYRAALAARPDAQSAGIGLSLDLMRMGHRDDGAAVAAAIVAAPAGVPDPWTDFDAADARLVPAYLDELRKSLR